MKKFMIAAGLSSVLLLGACSGDKEDTPVADNMEKEELQTDVAGAPDVQYNTDVEFDQALEEYEKALHKDGWKTIYDNKPSEIKVQKDDAVYRIHAVSINGETKIQKYEDGAPNETDAEEKTDEK